MSYAASVLQPGEKVIATARLHWIIYGWTMLCLAVGVVLLALELLWAAPGWLIQTTLAVFCALSFAAFIYAWFIRWITEFAVTDRRVISSRVFISRDIEEMNMDKVETVDIAQTVLGRVLGYGKISITGTGGSNDITVARIAQPFALRNAIIAR
jgi:uncharacterized membrane protein YdbT with pleckstrin-like domain